MTEQLLGAVEQLRAQHDEAARALDRGDTATARARLAAARTILTILGASIEPVTLNRSATSIMVDAMRKGQVTINNCLTTPTRIKLNQARGKTCLHLYYAKQWPDVDKGHRTLFDSGETLPGGES